MNNLIVRRIGNSIEGAISWKSFWFER